MLLNDLSCKNAKPKSKPYKLNDGDGLWLFVNPNGKKYWRCNYKYHEKENRLSFGAYPRVSLADDLFHGRKFFHEKPCIGICCKKGVATRSMQ